MPARADDDPKHELGLWLPLALADIYTTMLAGNGVKKIPAVAEVLRAWQLGTLADALSAPITVKPHKQGGIFGSELAAMFAKELK